MENNSTKFELWIDYFYQSYRKLNYYGEAYLTAFQETSCNYIFDDSLASTSNDPQDEINGFMESSTAAGLYCPSENLIRIGPCAFDDISHFYSTAFHEGIHAIQYNTCPTLYAYIGSNNLLALTPLDLIIQNQLIEMDATAKGNLFALLLEDLENGDNTVDFSNRPQKLHEILCDLSENSLTIPMMAGRTLGSLFVDRTLDEIEEHISNLSDSEIDEIEYTTLSTENMWELCNSINIQSVYRDSKAAAPPYIEFNTQQLNRIDVANRKLGIFSRGNLKNFDTAIHDKGIERSKFLETMKSL